MAQGNKRSRDLHQLGIDFSESMILAKLKRCRGEASGVQAGVTGAQVGLPYHSPAFLDDRTLVRCSSPLLSSQRGPGRGHATVTPTLLSLSTAVDIIFWLII